MSEEIGNEIGKEIGKVRRKVETQIDRALLDPAAVFQHPSDVVSAAGIDQATKIEILRRWEYDAREIQVEEEEAPSVGLSSDLFDRVLEALHQLGALRNSTRRRQRNRAAFDR